MNLSDDEIPDELRELIKSADESLEPISPNEAIEEYLEYREPEIRPQTVEEYRRKLGHFRDFCEQREIENLNELDGRTINDFRKYRRMKSAPQHAPLSVKTMRDDLYLFRDFVEYLGYIEAVPAELSKKVDVPELGAEDGVRDMIIAPERVKEVIEYLHRYEYATRAHVVWLFHAHTGRRPGGLYAIDLEDLHLDSKEPYIELRHRPPETELKNNYESETEIHLADDAAQVFQDYINKNRIDIETENGRKPFLTSNHGRLTKSPMQKYVYKFSRPCTINGECPHDQEIDSCQAAQYVDSASNCPSSRSPYALRHGYLTSQRSEGVPDRFISGRCDVSPEVLEKHYDERDEAEKRELRQEVFEKVRDEESGGGYL